MLNASDIYYVESVDKHTFIYCEKKICSTDLRLYQLLETLSPVGFVQISKSCYSQYQCWGLWGACYEQPHGSHFKNGERLNVSRKYLADIKSKLQEGI